MPLRGSALWDLRSGGSVSTEALITPTGILLSPKYTKLRPRDRFGRMRLLREWSNQYKSMAGLLKGFAATVASRERPTETWASRWRDKNNERVDESRRMGLWMQGSRSPGSRGSPESTRVTASASTGCER